MRMQFQPVQLATDSDDSESQHVFFDGLLVAVLVHLSEMHEERAGMWYLEVGFGPISSREQPSFVDLVAAQAWITQRLGRGRMH